MKGKKNRSCKAQVWEILLSGMLETNALLCLKVSVNVRCMFLL